MTTTTTEKKAVKISLKRLGETKYGDMQWGFRNLIITRMKWELPFVSISYRISRDGVKIDDLDTLRDVRDTIAMMIEEGEKV